MYALECALQLVGRWLEQRAMERRGYLQPHGSPNDACVLQGGARDVHALLCPTDDNLNRPTGSGGSPAGSGANQRALTVPASASSHSQLPQRAEGSRSSTFPATRRARHPHRSHYKASTRPWRCPFRERRPAWHALAHAVAHRRTIPGLARAVAEQPQAAPAVGGHRATHNKSHGVCKLK